VRTLVTFALAAAAAPAPLPPAPLPPAPPAATFTPEHASVSPRHAYAAGRPVLIAFTVAAPAPLALQVDVVREATGRAVRRLRIAAAAPGVAQRLTWDALTGGGDVAPDGRYRIRVAAPGGEAHDAGTLTLHSHVYPIRGRHADRGAAGAFGVPRSGGRTHEGFDVFAPCGTPVVAARGGRVVRVFNDPVLYGNIVVIRGAHTHRDYWYAHLLRAPRLHAGQQVLTGRRIGSIGATGNARTIGCQLHFELRPRGRPIDPAPALHAWDRWS
jgi:murein DD-endopeptidase MepM/ murein hydrolase activator NlpD